MEKELLDADSAPVGLVAGSGQFPIEFTKNGLARGHKIIVLAHRGETDPIIESLGATVYWIKFGQFGKIIKILKSEGVKRVAFAGGISRPSFFKGNLWIDIRGMSVLAKVKSVKDDVVLRAIVAELESEGLAVFSATEFLPESVVTSKQLTKRGLTEDELTNAKVGWEAAKLIGRAEIGQTVVASKSMVVAVEAIEGTDETIKRAGLLSQREGGVVVKVCKPQQDTRLDLPTVGINTIKMMQASGLTALVVETGRCVVIDPLSVVKCADSSGIAVVSFSDQELS